MIVASLLLILVAVTLLVLGLAGGSSVLLVGSIVASLLAAVALVIGARQAAAARVAEADATATDGDLPGAGRWGPGFDEPYGVDPARSGFPAAAPHADPAGPYPDAAGPYPDAAATFPDAAVPAGRQPSDGPVPDVAAVGDYADDGDVDPPDEPAAEQTSEAERVVLARIDAEVIVVDGRPRYHLPGCVHLLTRTGEPLPVREALELGFSACSLCGPNQALLTEAGRV